MAGFFPHVGLTSVGGYTPLPVTSVTGILDSIVTDIGAGVNGWTVFDDQRTTGVTYPWAVYVWHNGAYTNSVSTVNNCFTFTNGSNQAWCSADVGYNWAASITSGEVQCTGVVPVANQPPISVDGTNWYRAAYTTWAYPRISATLDRNFAQASTFTANLSMRLEKYIVLKCTSTTKTFYVSIGQVPGTTFLYVQPWEFWNNTTHAGTGGGQIEVCRGGYWDNRYAVYPTYTASVEVQYVMCLYPEAMFFWIHEENNYPPNYGPTAEVATAFYVGNLDTTGIKSSDPDALWFGCSDTSNSGIRCTGGVDHATQWTQWGSSQCLRTSNGAIWQQFNTYHAWAPKDNMYMFTPRGRPYTKALDSNINISNQGYFNILDVDIYQVGMNDADSTALGAQWCSEGRRGKVRYLKVPAFNPSGMHLATFGPSQDGYTYMMIMCSYPFLGAGNLVNGGVTSLMQIDVNTQSVPSSFAEGNGPMGSGHTYDSTFSDITSNIGTSTSLYRFLMIPMI